MGRQGVASGGGGARGRGGTPVGCGRTATKRELPRGAEAVGRPDGMGLHKAEGDRRGGTGTKRELSRGDNHLSLIPEGTEWNGTGLYRTGLTGTTRTSASCRSCLAQPRPKRAPPCPPAGGVTVGRPPPGRRPLVIRALTGRVGGREGGGGGGGRRGAAARAGRSGTSIRTNPSNPTTHTCAHRPVPARPGRRIAGPPGCRLGPGKDAAVSGPPAARSARVVDGIRADSADPGKARSLIARG